MFSKGLFVLVAKLVGYKYETARGRAELTCTDLSAPPWRNSSCSCVISSSSLMLSHFQKIWENWPFVNTAGIVNKSCWQRFDRICHATFDYCEDDDIIFDRRSFVGSSTELDKILDDACWQLQSYQIIMGAGVVSQWETSAHNFISREGRFSTVNKRLLVTTNHPS